MKLLLSVVLISGVLISDSSAQTTHTGPGSGTRPFKEGGSRNFWMGRNYRAEWNKPVTAPVISLATENGGLTPVKRGGGKQTRSLRLEDKNGRQYSLRSVEKFITSKTLPGDLQSDAAADLVADGISASYPYSALSMQALADAAGVPYGKVKLVYVGSDPVLGEEYKEYGNMLALLEERLPASVDKGYDTDEVADKLEDDNDNDVDQLALLRARILDMFVMDLDRHEDQWQWGAVDKDKGKTFFPIPRDRDQAWYINQGLLPGMIKFPWLVPQLQGFEAQSKNISRFNFAARNLDRFFLNRLSEEDWKQAVDKFLTQMTDAVIEKAMLDQPAEIRPISADKIVAVMKERRKYLADEVMEYYRFLARAVDITGSDKKELFEVSRNSDGSTLLQVYKVNSEGQQSTKIYERNFSGLHTRELRLYGMGGDDKFLVKGSEDKIKLRFIGGGGEDSYENTASGKAGNIYDRENDTKKVTGKFRDKSSNDTLVNSYQRLSYNYNTISPFLSINYNQDDGVFLGLSLKVVRHGFGKTPYKTLHEFSANHALATNAYNFKWHTEFMSVLGRTTDLLFNADIKAPSWTTNFFGYGTGTIYDKTKPGKFKFYRARYKLGDVNLLLRQRFSEKVQMNFGPAFQFFELDSNNNKGRYILQTAQNGLDPATLFKKQSYFGGIVTLVIDTRDNKVIPRRGVVWNNSVQFLSGLNDTKNSVTRVNSEFTFFLKFAKTLFFANRVGAGHNFGDFEFYQAQFLGSEDNLRGFRKSRFAGHSKFFNNTELRWAFAKFKTYLFPGAIGLLAFVDAGRVWADGNTTSKLQNGYGGGLWISPLTRIVLTFTYAVSKEDKMPLVGLGWKF